MDESWRVPIGSVVPRRRSTEEQTSHHSGPSGGGLDASDFRDVFGGPPRSVLLRQFSRGGDFTPTCSSVSSFFDSRLPRDHHHRSGFRRWPSFDEEVLRCPLQHDVVPGLHGGSGDRKLPCFTNPAAAAEGVGGVRTGGARGWGTRAENAFYDDVLDWGGGAEPDRRSRTKSRQSTSKSKSNGSSVMSSEDGSDLFSRLPPSLADDGVLSSFASKLRPISVPSRRRGGSPSPAIVSMGEQTSSWRTSTVPCPRPSSRECRVKGSVTRPEVYDPYRHFRPYSPVDTVVDLEPKMPVAADDDLGSDPPSSALSSIYDDIPLATIVPVRAHEKLALQEFGKEVTVSLEDEEAESYTIEIVPSRRKAVDADVVGAVEEAIAWAKEKFLGLASPEETRVGDDSRKQGPKTQEEEEHVKSIQELLVSGEEGNFRFYHQEEGMLDVVHTVMKGWREGCGDDSAMKGKVIYRQKVWITDEDPHTML